MKKSYYLILILIFTVKIIVGQQTTHFIFTSNTGNNATVALPVSINPNIGGVPLSVGDEIGVFSSSGLCVGGIVWNQENAAITIWGDDEMTPIIDGIQVGDSIHYRVWKKSTNTEYPVTNVSYSLGDGKYIVNGIYILNSFSVTSVEKLDNPYSLELLQNFPNPFNGITKIVYLIPEKINVNISIYNILGYKITELVNQIHESGIYELNFDASNLPNGIYFYQLEAGKVKAVRKMILMK
jgi:hypothetical protein